MCIEQERRAAFLCPFEIGQTLQTLKGNPSFVGQGTDQVASSHSSRILGTGYNASSSFSLQDASAGPNLSRATL